MPEAEGHAGEGEGKKHGSSHGKKHEANIGSEPSRLVAIAKRTTVKVERELRKIPLFKKHFPPYFEEIEGEMAAVLSVAEVKLKEEPEGKTEEEKTQAVINRIYEKIVKDGVIEAGLGIADRTKILLDYNQWTFGESCQSEEWTPEIKKSAEKNFGFEINIHKTWKFPDAKPLPIELQIAGIAISYDPEKKKFLYGALQGEGTVTAIEFPKKFEVKGMELEGPALEGKLTITGQPDYKELFKKVWEHAKPLGKQAAEKLGEGARAALTWADENLTLVISEDGELVATAALDVILTVAVVVLVVVSLGAILYALEIESGLDGIDEQRKRLTDELTSFYVKGLQGEHLQNLTEWEQNQAFQTGKKRREELIAKNGDGFDDWLKNNESDVVDEARKQFRIVVSDWLWAGWADDHHFAKDKWLGWITLYGGGTDPKGLKKMPLFEKYGKDAWQAPKGWESGEWTASGVHQYFQSSTE